MKETSDGENNGRFSCQSKKKNSERQTNLKHSAVGRAAPQPPAPNNCIRIGFGRGIVVTARYATRSNASRSSALAPNNSKAACCSALRVNSSLTFLSSRNFATKIETCGKESERERKKKRERERKHRPARRPSCRSTSLRPRHCKIAMQYRWWRSDDLDAQRVRRFALSATW